MKSPFKVYLCFFWPLPAQILGTSDLFLFLHSFSPRGRKRLPRWPGDLRSVRWIVPGIPPSPPGEKMSQVKFHSIYLGIRAVSLFIALTWVKFWWVFTFHLCGTLWCRDIYLDCTVQKNNNWPGPQQGTSHIPATYAGKTRSSNGLCTHVMV